MATILYTVQPGDTLYAIAEKYGTTVDKIVRQNGIRTPDEIYPGLRLRITEGDSSDKEPAIFQWYVVRRGDTLGTIANRFGLELSQLLALNNVKDPDLIYPGQLIRVR